MENLKPCPFCGSDAEIVPILTTIPRVFVIRCVTHCCSTKGYTTQEEAIEAWNRRKADGT